MKRILAVDLDDVLSESFESIISFHNAVYKTEHTRNDMATHHLSDIWAVERDLAIQRVSEWFNSPFYMDTKPVHGAYDALHKLTHNGFEIVIVTSRPEWTRPHSLRWLDTHFAGLYSKLYITDQYTNPSSPLTKGVICDELGAVGLVDDVISYLIDVTKRGMRGYQFDKPWNQTESAPSVKRIVSWDEIPRDLLQSFAKD